MTHTLPGVVTPESQMTPTDSSGGGRRMWPYTDGSTLTSGRITPVVTGVDPPSGGLTPSSDAGRAILVRLSAASGPRPERKQMRGGAL